MVKEEEQQQAFSQLIHNHWKQLEIKGKLFSLIFQEKNMDVLVTSGFY
jgi:hypothetical protein